MEPIAEEGQVVPIGDIWAQIVSLSWLEAVLAVSFGIVYLLYGWRIFRILVVICFALIGMYLGMTVGEMAGSKLWGGVIGLGVFAGISAPLMKWCVCILGAVAGGIWRGGLWYAFKLPEEFLWAGASVGLVAGGMISFIVLKVAVMLFTSLGGSIITALGMLRLLDLYENTSEPYTNHIETYVHELNWFLPVVLIVPTIIGIVAQNKFIKHADKWDF
jgi:hypothetical protein